MQTTQNKQSPFSARQWCRINMQQQGLLDKTWQVADLLERLSYVQIDSINVVQRAHHHVLHTRIEEYSPKMLDQALIDKQVFEYWSHAAAYLPMKDYAYSLYRKHQIAQGDKHWHAPNKNMMHEVLARIQAEGPLQAKDFENFSSAGKSGWWDWKPAKKALEQLFMQGELMVVGRRNFQKVYDLTENVLPSIVDTTRPNDLQFSRHLIDRCIAAHGFASAQQISYLRKGMKKFINQTLNELLEDNRLAKFEHEKETYYYHEHIRPPAKVPNKTWLLNPFDNIAIQRKRTQAWYNFNYQIEVYVPENKRTYGYYSLLILWQDRLVGRVSVKADRKDKVLLLQHLHFEDYAFKNKPHSPEKFIAAFLPSLNAYMQFNNCQSWQLLKCNDRRIQQLLCATTK